MLAEVGEPGPSAWVKDASEEEEDTDAEAEPTEEEEAATVEATDGAAEADSPRTVTSAAAFCSTSTAGRGLRCITSGVVWITKAGAAA